MDILKREIIRRIRLGHGIDSVSLLAFARRRQIPTNLVSKALATCLPYLETRPITTKLNPRCAYMKMRGSDNLGTIQFDLFYPTTDPEVPKGRIHSCLLFVDILSRCIWTEKVYGSKSSPNILAALKRFVAIYRREFNNKTPSVFFSDKETSFQSVAIERYLKRVKITSVYLERRHKAMLAEKMIGALKRLFAQSRDIYHHYKDDYKLVKPRHMHLEMKKLTSELNKRPIVVNSKIIGQYRPIDLTYRNVARFVKTLNDAFPERRADNYIFRNDNFPFKFQIGNLVKHRLFNSNAAFFKKSTQTLASSVYIVRKRFLFLAGNMTLQPGYLTSRIKPLKKRKRVNRIKEAFFMETELVLIRT